jgi:hypothetical protein
LRDPKGYIPLSTRETVLHYAGVRREDVTEKGNEIEDFSTHQPAPWKRGKLRLIKKPKEIQAPSELHTHSSVEKLLMRIVRLEPVEGSSRGIGERRRRSGDENVDDQESSQQLKQAHLAIAELYQ